MSLSVETKLDFDRSVNTEDRFAIRKLVDLFVRSVNQGEREVYDSMISDAIIVEGFSDIPYVKQGFVNMLARRFTVNHQRLMRFPALKLTYTRYLFQLQGTYEEFDDGVLATEGTITVNLVKNEKGYELVRILFYPRMIQSEAWNTLQ